MSRQRDALLDAASNNVKPFRDQDRFLPIANVGKVMRNALGKKAKISLDSKECIQECVSEFISFVTMEAAEKCAIEKRKTMTGEDLLFALKKLGFDNHADAMSIFLAKYKAMSAHLTDGFVADIANSSSVNGGSPVGSLFQFNGSGTNSRKAKMSAKKTKSTR